ncbi:MAG: hypothetical protein ACLGHX_14380 [Acidimicrobiia bacterium]
MDDIVTSGREAVRKHAWSDAYDLFARADAETDGGLEPADLEAMSESAWWSGRPDEAEDALQRAFAGHVRNGDQVSAALVAARLSVTAFEKGSMPVSQGWMSQAERVLAGVPESVAHAWLELIKTAQAIPTNDPDAIITHADRALELARTHGEPDVEAMATSLKGAALLRKGAIEDGLALIDAATALATTGVVRPKVACDVYCVTISTCRDLADYRRAGEWIDIAERWMQRESLSGYTGVCRVHRAELSRLRGAWDRAEEEARRACVELERHRLLTDVGLAYTEVGEVRRHRGDLTAAEEAYSRAYEFGWDPQPGLALLYLARGEVDKAWSSIERSLAAADAVAGSEQIAPNPLARSRLLPAAVEIALAKGDIATARAAADELDQIARSHPGAAREAHAFTARGRVALSAGDSTSAITALDRAWRTWQELSVPYESARARQLMGEAKMAVGDLDDGRRDLQAAHKVFRELGARRDVAEVDRVLGADADSERVTRTFLFTDIVTSTDLIGLIGDDAWKELLHWHDRTLMAAFTAHGGEVVRHTGDGFFVTFADVETAIECATDIQRQLADHRREHGFAPSVRIGMHTAEATLEPSDYSGHGVHVAARVAAMADRDEIVVTASSLPDGLAFDRTGSEAVLLKGLADPVEIVRILWR